MTVPNNQTYGTANDLFESYLRNDTSEAALDITPSLISWTEVITVYDFKKDVADPANASFMLHDAYSRLKGTGAMVAVGDPHPSIKDAYAVSASLRAKTTDSTTHVQQVIRYQQPGDFCEVEFQSFQQSEVRTFAEDPTGVHPVNDLSDTGDTRLTAIFYKPMGPLGQATVAATNTDVPIVARINVPSILRAIRVTQYESRPGKNSSTPSSLATPIRPTWNNAPIWGFRAGELLLMGIESSSTGTAIYRRVYTILINQYGWHHFYGVFTLSNGLTPYLIQPINPLRVLPTNKTVRTNGAAAFRMLPSADFFDLCGDLKPPMAPFVDFSLAPNTADANPSDYYTEDPYYSDYTPIPGDIA